MLLPEILLRLKLLNVVVTTLCLRSARRRPVQSEFVSNLRDEMFHCVDLILYWACSHQTDVHTALSVFKRHANLPDTVLNYTKSHSGLLEGVNSKATSSTVVQITLMGQVSWHCDFHFGTVSNRSMKIVKCADMLCVNLLKPTGHVMHQQS